MDVLAQPEGTTKSEQDTRTVASRADARKSPAYKDRARRLRLPTAPAKPSDKRAFRGQTCQAEAIAPDELARIVRAAIEARTDKCVLDRVLKREKRERPELIKRLT